MLPSLYREGGKREMEMSAINPIACVVAGLAGFAFGAVYYTILGPAWRISVGMSKEQANAIMSAKVMIRAALCQVILAVALSVLAGPEPSLEVGMQTGFILALGVIAATMAVNHGFQGKPLSLTFIDSSHWFGVLTVQGIVLSFF